MKKIIIALLVFVLPSQVLAMEAWQYGLAATIGAAVDTYLFHAEELEDLHPDSPSMQRPDHVSIEGTIVWTGPEVDKWTRMAASGILGMIVTTNAGFLVNDDYDAKDHFITAPLSIVTSIGGAIVSDFINSYFFESPSNDYFFFRPSMGSGGPISQLGQLDEYGRPVPSYDGVFFGFEKKF